MKIISCMELSTLAAAVGGIIIVGGMNQTMQKLEFQDSTFIADMSGISLKLVDDVQLVYFTSATFGRRHNFFATTKIFNEDELSPAKMWDFFFKSTGLHSRGCRDFRWAFLEVLFRLIQYIQSICLSINRSIYLSISFWQESLSKNKFCTTEAKML